MLFLLYYTTFSTVLQYKFPEFFVNITNHGAERKDKKENRREAQLIKRLPCVKGAPPKAVRDCFFTNLQPLRGFRTRLGDACKRASHTRKSLSHKRGLIKINPRRRRTSSLRFSLLSFLSAPWFVMFTKNSGNLYCKTVENVV